MKIILKEDVKTLGKKGDIKEVTEGYARNFLLPRRLAEAATEASIKNAEIKKEKEKEDARKQREKAKDVIEKIQGKKISIRSKEKKGKLFGSISAKDIIKELAKEGIAVNEKSVKMESSIKKVGNYTIRIALENDLEAKVDLAVESDN